MYKLIIILFVVLILFLIQYNIKKSNIENFYFYNVKGTTVVEIDIKKVLPNDFFIISTSILKSYQAVDHSNSRPNTKLSFDTNTIEILNKNEYLNFLDRLSNLANATSNSNIEQLKKDNTVNRKFKQLGFKNNSKQNSVNGGDHADYYNAEIELLTKIGSSLSKNEPNLSELKSNADWLDTNYFNVLLNNADIKIKSYGYDTTVKIKLLIIYLK